MDTWRFQKIKDDNAIVGVITAVSPEAKDCDLVRSFPYLEFGSRENHGKAVVIDREKIDSKNRFATVTVTDGKPEWNTLAMVADPATVEKVHNLITKMPEFTWGEKEDQEVLEKGITIMWAEGKTKRIQSFVEALSHKVGVKVDWSFQGGRAHIEVMPGGLLMARRLIKDKEFMGQFYKSYNDDPDDYFERLR